MPEITKDDYRMVSRLPLSIIADDLTGAADTGIQFAKRGFYTVLLPSGMETALFRDPEVIALNTATRGMQAGSAYDEVKNAALLLMQMLHTQAFYKKIDSTLRGNVGVEIEAVMDATGCEFAILAPAFPACGRTTEAGVHLVNGCPVAHTEAAADPVSPVWESHLPTLIRSQTGLMIGHIVLAEVRHGSEALRQSILQHLGDKERIIIFDAVTDEDLSKIVEAGMSMTHTPLMVGSAGLANQLSRSWSVPEVGQTHGSIHTETSSEGLIIIVSGSLSAVTSGQLDRVRETGAGKIIPIDICNLIEDQRSSPEWESGIIPEIMAAAKTSRVIGIQSARITEPEEIRDLPRLVVEWLGKITLQVIRSCPNPPRGMILAGGDTALAVFKQLGISEVQLIDEILPGIPYGRIISGEFAGMDIVTKAGAFGDANALVKCIDFLIGA